VASSAVPWVGLASSVSARAVRSSSTVTTTTHGGRVASGLPWWVSPRLMGFGAQSQLDRLAASVDGVSGAPNAHATSGLRGGGAGGSVPRVPSGPPCDAGGSAGGSAGGAFAGGWAAVGVTAVVCRPSPLLRSHSLLFAVWRAMAFVSLQERPG
jgi:hypothetical protein